MHRRQTKKKLSTALQRTMTGISGAVGGFALAAGMTADIWDQCEHRQGPGRCELGAGPGTREEWIPVSGEASLAIQPPGRRPLVKEFRLRGA